MKFILYTDPGWFYRTTCETIITFVYMISPNSEPVCGFFVKVYLTIPENFILRYLRDRGPYLNLFEGIVINNYYFDE